MLEAAAGDGTAWREAATAADERAPRIGGTPGRAALADRRSARAPIDFRGYAYRREPSAGLGRAVTRYDPTTPQIWHVPLFDEVAPAVTVDAPRGGYVVPAGQAGTGRRRSWRCTASRAAC